MHVLCTRSNINSIPAEEIDQLTHARTQMQFTPNCFRNLQTATNKINAYGSTIKQLLAGTLLTTMCRNIFITVKLLKVHVLYFIISLSFDH